MKQKFFIVVLLLFNLAVIAQTSYVSYGYDPSGNRVSRVIAYDSSPPNGRIQQPTDTTVQKSDTLAQQQQLNPYIELLGSQQITIFPNPTKGLLVVDITNMQDIKTSSIALYDLGGREVFSKSEIKNTNSINFANEPPGMYGLRIILDGKITEWKVIKQ